MSITFALAGNPNCGKTTLFNCLTGARQHVGNWPGVTVEQKQGVIKRAFAASDLPVAVVDLPGIDSLSALSAEKRLAGDFLTSGQADVIVSVISASQLERGLYLTTYLLQQGVPVVGALTMMDELQRQGDTLCCETLSKQMGVPFVPVDARLGHNVQQLVTQAAQAAQQGGAVLPAISALQTPQQRHHFAQQVARFAVQRGNLPKRPVFNWLDKLTLHPVFALPLFVFVLWGVFALAFGSGVNALQQTIEHLWQTKVCTAMAFLLNAVGTPDFLRALLVQGVLKGMGTALSFLPQIAVLFCLLAFLEDCGYMVRVAFLLDRLMRPFGLGGKAVIPMVIGFGCSVPAILATRTLDSERERRIAILVTPFLSCSARLPIYVLLAGTFFKRHQHVVVLALYLFGVVVAMACARLLSKAVYGGAHSRFVLEIPPYRLPTLRNVLLHVWERVWDFTERATTIVVVSSAVVWLLQSVAVPFAPDTSQGSLFWFLGRAMAPLFAPLGFGHWQASAALLAGVAAKEMVVVTLGMTGTALTQLFTPASALSFSVFCLLYLPCFATFAVTRSELKSTKWAVFAALNQITVAWVLSFVVYRLLVWLG